MIRESKKGKRLFPKALEKLFIENKDRLIEKIEITEDLIRLNAYAYSSISDVSLKSDNDIAKWLMGLSSSGNTSSFSFITNWNGDFVNDIKILNNEAYPDKTEDKFKSLGKKVSNINKVNESISSQIKLQEIFSPQTRFDILSKSNLNIVTKSDPARSSFEKIRERLVLKREVQAKTLQELIFSNNSDSTNYNALQILNNISQYVSERQSLLKTLHSTLKNIREGYLLDKNPDNARAVLDPYVYAEIPELISNMVEDENLDDIGYNSGKRFVIEDKEIINFTIEETPPNYVTIDVNGLYGDGFTQPATGLGIGQNGGNQQSTVIAVDYDLWRMYGWKASETLTFPYLSDTTTQLAPLAVFLLNLERRRILGGTAIVVGNEYYQPGDVVYLESKDLLFYVESVQHSFSYGGIYQTTLQLRYGHNPGEYIPTILDIVGKALFANNKQTNLIRLDRNSSPNGEEALMAFAIPDYNSQSTQTIDLLLNGKFSDKNRANLVNLLRIANGTTQNTTEGQKLVIKLRVYTNSNNGASFNFTTLKKAAQSIKDWLLNPEVNNPNKNTGSLFKTPSEETEKWYNIDESSIQIESVDIANSRVVNPGSEVFNPLASPSNFAVSLARSIMEQGGSSPNIPNEVSGALSNLSPNAVLLGSENTTSQIDNVIYNFIIDVWSGYEEIKSQTQTTKVPDRGDSSQAANNSKAAVKTADSAKNKDFG